MTTRREMLIALGASALLAAPLARAQPARGLVRIGILEDAREGVQATRWQAFRDRMRELGYIEGKNLVIDARSSNGEQQRLPALAAELVALTPAVIVTVTTTATRAAMQATQTIPIVFQGPPDPVAQGLVTSLAHPGGNVTGQTIMSTEVSAKWIELLIELVPKAKRFAFLGQLSNQAIRAVFQSMQDPARARNVSVRLLEAGEPAAINRSFEVMVQEKFDGFMVASAPVLLSHRQQIVDLAARHRLPGVYAVNEYVTTGGLLSYGPDRIVMFRRAADYVHRILQGAKPSDLPVEQPTRFELVVNLKTAKALGIKIPQSILVRADKVIK